MQQRTLGSSDIEVGAVGLGCMGMTFGYTPAERDDAESVAVIHRALELGVTLIDTADVYGPFTNEVLVGRALQGRRDDAVLATKCGLVGDDPIRRDARPEHIRSGCDASLERLGVEVIDLYQLHRVDENVPLEDSWGAMSELVAAGKVRALGLSEVNVDELARANAIHPVTSVQSELSLWTRGPLDEVLPWCEANGAAFIPFSPLGRGFLTGALPASQTFEEKDMRSRNPRFQPEALDANQRIVAEVRAVAEQLSATAAQVAIAWTLAQGDQVIPIPGTKRLRWLEDNAGAASVELPADALARLDALPAAVGERY